MNTIWFPIFIGSITFLCGAFVIFVTARRVAYMRLVHKNALERRKITEKENLSDYVTSSSSDEAFSVESIMRSCINRYIASKRDKDTSTQFLANHWNNNGARDDNHRFSPRKKNKVS